MALEVRVMPTCRCGEWDVQIAEDQAKAEERLRVRGWTFRPEVCPTCLKKPKGDK